MHTGAYAHRLYRLPPTFHGLRATNPNLSPSNLTTQQGNQTRDTSQECKCDKSSCFWWAVAGTGLGLVVGYALG